MSFSHCCKSPAVCLGVGLFQRPEGSENDISVALGSRGYKLLLRLRKHPFYSSLTYLSQRFGINTADIIRYQAHCQTAAMSDTEAYTGILGQIWLSKLAIRNIALAYLNAIFTAHCIYQQADTLAVLNGSAVVTVIYSLTIKHSTLLHKKKSGHISYPLLALSDQKTAFARIIALPALPCILMSPFAIAVSIAFLPAITPAKTSASASISISAPR